MAGPGGKREGAGRKKGYAALQAEKARELICKALEKELVPIIEVAIEQAKTGDRYAREWLIERGYGKVPNQIELPDDSEGEIIFKWGNKK
jgi:hypothetical protein